MLPFALLALTSCQQSGVLEIARVPLELEVTSPEYGIYTGTDSVRVTGVVQPRNAVVTVENREVVVGTDGSFEVEVPIAGVYRNVDIRAFYFEETASERIPVFSHTNPVENWPGGMGLRLTPRMLEGFADQIAVTIDELGWQQGLLDAFPGVDTAGFVLRPTEVRSRATEVSLIPDDEGMALEIRIRDIVMELDAGFQLGDAWVEAPSEIGFEELLLTARVGLQVDGAGMLVLTTGDAEFSLTDPILQLGPFDGGLLDFVVQFVGDLVSGIGNFALDALLGAVAEVPLGGPFEFELDLLGTPLAMSLADLGTDTEGIYVDLGLSFGQPVPDPLVIHRPTLEQGGPQADMILALHEGLFSPLVESELLDLLEQDLQLEGVLGLGLGLVFQGLPGGDTAPEADGWCVRINPGGARSARMSASLDQFATLYLPDLQMTVGITHDGIQCDPWLTASLAVEASFVVEGTALNLDLAIPDGAVSFYAATGDYTDVEVVEGLGGLFDLLFGLLGGSFGFDLADLLGGGLIPGVEGDPQILGVYAIEDATGEPVDGLYAVSLDLL